MLASQVHTDPPQCIKRIGHETFTASLVDRWLSAIG
jgi:hypothetical protein